MGVRILEGVFDSDTSGAVMICSTTMVAFGPVFDTEQECELFIKWFDSRHAGTVRSEPVTVVIAACEEFRKLICECDCGELRFIGQECELCRE